MSYDNDNTRGITPHDARELYDNVLDQLGRVEGGVDEAQDYLIDRAMRRTRSSSKTAELLGISARKVQYKLDEFRRRLSNNGLAIPDYLQKSCKRNASTPEKTPETGERSLEAALEENTK